MQFLFSLLFGVAIAVASTLIHQTFPPVGAVIGIFATYIGIWFLGRRYGKRRYKFFGLLGWFFIISKAGSFGVGRELLIQGDNQGSALLTIGFLVGIVALVQRP